MLAQLSRWQFLSWWRKSLLVAASGLLLAIFLVLATATVVATNAQSGVTRWLAVSILPLVVLVAMGVLSRLQNRIDLGGGGPSDHGERGVM